MSDLPNFITRTDPDKRDFAASTDPEPTRFTTPLVEITINVEGVIQIRTFDMNNHDGRVAVTKCISFIAKNRLTATIATI